MISANLMSNSNRSIANKKSSDGKKSYEVMTSFQGPLPSPDILQGFEYVLPGAAERIMKMAEKEQDARHKIERKLSSLGIFVMILGIVAGIFSLITIGYLIKYAIDNNAIEVAVTLSSTSLIGVIGIFVWFRISKKIVSNTLLLCE